MAKFRLTVGAGLLMATSMVAMTGMVVSAGQVNASEPSLSPSKCGKLTANADGTSSPVICPNGHPNAKLWKSIKTGTPQLAELGANPTWKQVKAASCADLRDASNPIVINSYQWLATRYDWLEAGLPGAETLGRKLVNGMCN